jgi:hypothetical protein
MIGGRKSVWQRNSDCHPDAGVRVRVSDAPDTFSAYVREVALRPPVAGPSRWRDLDQTPMPTGLQGLEHVSALAARVELFQSVV